MYVKCLTSKSCATLAPEPLVIFLMVCNILHLYLEGNFGNNQLEEVDNKMTVKWHSIHYRLLD